MFQNILERKNILIIFLVILIIIISASFFTFWLKTKVSQSKIEILPQIVKPEQFGAGSIGEVVIKDEKTGQEAPLVSPTIPPAIFNTTGVITELKSDRIIVEGKGTNFADGVARRMAVIFTANTLTFSKNKTFRWLGLTGLKHLQPGIQILIGGEENIRGKTEFKAKTISVL